MAEGFGAQERQRVQPGSARGGSKCQPALPVGS